MMRENFAIAERNFCFTLLCRAHLVFTSKRARAKEARWLRVAKETWPWSRSRSLVSPSGSNNAGHLAPQPTNQLPSPSTQYFPLPPTFGCKQKFGKQEEQKEDIQ